MSAATLPNPSWPDAHRRFLDALPHIDDTIRFQFRRWPRRLRDEAAADARADAWLAWHGLLARGRDPLDVGPTGIAFNACRYEGRPAVRSRVARPGRHGRLQPPRPPAVGRPPHRPRPRDPRRRRAGGGPAGDAWRTWLAADRRSRPADQAAFRIDFAAWLGTLPPRRRRAAELLAAGHTTGAVARALGVTHGAVSQARAWLARSWGQFQGGPDGAA